MARTREERCDERVEKKHGAGTADGVSRGRAGRDRQALRGKGLFSALQPYSSCTAFLINIFIISTAVVHTSMKLTFSRASRRSCASFSSPTVPFGRLHGHVHNGLKRRSCEPTGELHGGRSCNSCSCNQLQPGRPTCQCAFAAVDHAGAAASPLRSWLCSCASRCRAPSPPS